MWPLPLLWWPPGCSSKPVAGAGPGHREPLPAAWRSPGQGHRQAHGSAGGHDPLQSSPEPRLNRRRNRASPAPGSTSALPEKYRLQVCPGGSETRSTAAAGPGSHRGHPALLRRRGLGRARRSYAARTAARALCLRVPLREAAGGGVLRAPSARRGMGACSPAAAGVFYFFQISTKCRQATPPWVTAPRTGGHRKARASGAKQGGGGVEGGRGGT